MTDTNQTLLFAERLFKMQNYYESNVDPDVLKYLANAYEMDAYSNPEKILDQIHIHEARRYGEPPQSIRRDDPTFKVRLVDGVVYTETTKGSRSMTKMIDAEEYLKELLTLGSRPDPVTKAEGEKLQEEWKRTHPEIEWSTATAVCSHQDCARDAELCRTCDKPWCSDCWESSQHLEICEGLRGL